MIEPMTPMTLVRQILARTRTRPAEPAEDEACESDGILQDPYGEA